MTKQNENTDESKVVIGNLTSVRIGVIIAILSLFASAVWWASSTTSKLDSILTFQTSTTTTITELRAKDISLDKEISDVKLKYALIEVDIKNFKDKLGPISNK